MEVLQHSRTGGEKFIARDFRSLSHDEKFSGKSILFAVDEYINSHEFKKRRVMMSA